MSEFSRLSDSPAGNLGPEHAGPSRSSSSSPVRASSTAGAGRKRIRPKVDLAPGQPPTARGNPRIRVFVACYQCRARKIRCDGAKPICCNCQKRPSKADHCNYDSGPNRRGREKSGGARARAARGPASQKTPKRKLSPQSDKDPPPVVPRAARPQDTVLSDSSDEPFFTAVDDYNSDGVYRFSNEMEMDWENDPLLDDAASLTDATFLAGLSSIPDFASTQEPMIVVTPPEDGNEEKDNESIPPRPGSRFARETWWDALLSLYAADDGFGDSDMRLTSISQAQRTASMKAIVSDLRALLQASPCWISYLHLPRFFDKLFSPVRRNSLQPSLMLAALALGTFAQSSEAEYGAKGRAKSLKLLDMANGALEASLSTGWVDIGLAQAALMIVFFEMQSHPQQSLERSQSSLLLLDSLFRLFGLTRIDENLKPRGHSPYGTIQPQGYNPAAYMGGTVQSLPTASYGTPGTSNVPLQAQASDFMPLPNTIPGLADGMSMGSVPRWDEHDHSSPPSHRAGCSCVAVSLGKHWPSVHKLAPSWAGTMMWPEGLTEAEFRREECRRLVWSSVMVIANLHAYTAAVPDVMIGGHAKLIVREPENFSLLFPSEALAKTGAMVDYDDIWTLNYRSMLLLHVCMRTREDPNLSPAERAQLSVQAWIEIDDIEQRLARHNCDLDSSFGFLAKELLFGLRMLTSYEFQRYIPQVTTAGPTLFYRDKAEAWLKYTDEAGQSVWESLSLGAESPDQDHRKSLLLFWFVANIRKALALWKADKGLIYALEFAKRISVHIEFLMMYWPNMRLRQLWQTVRFSLVEACLKAGIPPPDPALPRPIPKVDPARHADVGLSDLMM
ncbi:hypothetical protein DICSQDRAFT_132648 [Dichomitus squalens LYAD-421 SS1]|uniref:uncharacterized protein n=1 Tax=Dichomitus squalens (strain LYAD-421) TaxID=732165 RepID=UPI0004411A8C|nr:uncharacterized protein DICSQDRAFT_132648 [Dichomitus squalens LYAD-421 SS1]EJF65111.1 hypothetical protein DICSQDRAFT_132648 [Dichomitus squalens LYAD-421 SS1]